VPGSAKHSKITAESRAGGADNPSSRQIGDCGRGERGDAYRRSGKGERCDRVCPASGDFVGSGEPLFLLHGGAEAADEQKLRACVVLGAERTMEQDPLFAFRILVDIAIKALSKAINDPTTAVLAIDQLHRLLRSAGTRNLRTDQILDQAGKLRVIFRTPAWGPD
jgi:uncharacterized membrane protein